MYVLFQTKTGPNTASYGVVSIHVDHVFCCELGKLDAGEEGVRDSVQPGEAGGKHAEDSVEGKTEAGDPPRKQHEDEKPEDAIEALLGGGSHCCWKIEHTKSRTGFRNGHSHEKLQHFLSYPYLSYANAFHPV